MRYKITIEEPCTENWNEMNPTQKGAFCESCEKEVIDFTHMGPHALAKKVHNKENICGRFKPEQLNVPLPKITQSTFRKNAVALGFTSLLALSAPLAAQEKPVKPPTVHTVDRPIIMGKIAVQPKLTPSQTFTGIVLNDKTPLEGVEILLKGTDTSVKTGVDGKFTITISNKELAKNNTLTISHHGYLIKEHKLNITNKRIKVQLESELMILGSFGLIEHKKPSIKKRVQEFLKSC